MRGSNLFYEIILIIFGLLIASYLYFNINNFNLNPTARIVSDKIKNLGWEVLSYYINDTNIVVYLKPPDTIDISKIKIYINNQSAKIIPMGYYNGTIVYPSLGGFIEAIANYSLVQYSQGYAIQILISDSYPYTIFIEK